MAHFVVKILTADNERGGIGEKYDNPKWHYVSDWWDAQRTLCQGEAFGPGESSCTYKTKPLKKGSINCDKCIEMINEIKSISL